MDYIEIDDLKERLSKIHKQSKRRKILEKYEAVYTSTEDNIRFNKLKGKANLKVPGYIIFVKIGFWMYIPSWLIVIFAGMPYIQADTDTWYWFLLGMVVLPFAIWTMVGVPTLIILAIIILKKRKKDEYYLNIENI